MIFDTITLILMAAIILLAVATPFLSPFWKAPLPTTDEPEDSAEPEEPLENAEGPEEVSEEPSENIGEEPLAASEADETAECHRPLPAMTILITVQQKQATMLARHLPLFLDQRYDADFEVVVVAEKGDSDSEDVLNAYASHPRLYATYIPDSSRYMSRKKLAITLGVKAAHNEWIVLTDAHCSPSGDNWLSAIASHCPTEAGESACNLVIGYANYDDEAPAYYRFDRLMQGCHTMSEAISRTAYRSVGSNIAFRKSEFIQGDGFRGNLQDTRGEYEFMVNKYARRRQTAVATERDAWIIDDAPSRHTWLTHNIYYMHTRKHLKRSLSHRFLPFLNEVGIHLTFVACLAIIAFAALTQRWVLLGVAIAALVATIILRTWIARKVIVAYDEDIAAWRVYPYELSWLWHKCYHRLRYWRANKSDFTSHKV